MGYRQVVEGSVQVPLPDEPVARAKAFAEVAQAWSTMLSAVEHLMPPHSTAGTLTGNQRWYSPSIAWPTQHQVTPSFSAEPTPPKEPEPIAAKPNGKHRGGRPLGSKTKAKRRK